MGANPGKESEGQIDIRNYTPEKLAKDLANLIKDRLGMDNVSLDTKLSELDMDSLDGVELGLSIEERYKGVEMPDEYEVIKDMSVRELADYIRTRAQNSE
ncbi:acyl carrier protein [Candidatus Pacearchaeota archaeon]|nr:MAG: acyl carrier protein [Candidatus Pacearchaeota archaeon]